MAAHIIGCGYTKPTTKSGFKVFDMIKQSVEMSFASIHDNKINLSHLDGIIAMPSLAEPKFMDAHYIATRMNLFPKGKFIAKTIDVGGASPVSGLLEAKNLITNKGFELVAVVSADAVSSMSSTAFLSRANDGFSELAIEGDCSPYIPNAYDRIAQWHIDQVKKIHIVYICIGNILFFCCIGLCDQRAVGNGLRPDESTVKPTSQRTDKATILITTSA